MSWTCRKYRQAILNPTETAQQEPFRQALEKHLASCPRCRGLARANAAWQEFGRQWRDSREQAAFPQDLKQRIHAAIRLEAAQKSLTAAAPATAKPQRLRYLNQAASLAVVALLIVTGLHLFAPRPTQQTESAGRNQSLVSTQLPADLTKAAQETIKNPTFANSAAWQAYAGKWTDLTVTTSGSDAVKGLADQRLAQVMAALEQAETVRVFIRTAADAGQGGAPSSWLVLARFRDPEIKDRAAQAEKSLASCETPFWIEIIKAGDLPARLGNLDGESLAGLAAESADGSSWILVQIGE